MATIKHQFSPTILRKYDIRGIVNVDLCASDAYFLGLAFTAYLKEKNLNTVIAVAKDARHSGIELKKSVIQGIVDGGGTVVDCGICPTPACYFASYYCETAGFIMVTGSHNPLEYNGFKFGVRGQSFSEEEILYIANIAKCGLAKSENGSVQVCNIITPYIERIVSGLKLPDVKFGFNALNGSAGTVLPQLAEKIGGKIFECEMNATLPTVLDPSNTQNIQRSQEYLKQNGLDIMFMFDGDADRIMAVTPNKVLYGEDILLLCTREVLSKERGKVIFDVKCSNALANEIIKCKGTPIMYKTGHSLIKKKMIEEKAVLAGEYSGHIYFGNEYYGFDDGIYTAMRLLGYFAHNNFEHEINSIPVTFRSSEIKIPSSAKFEDIAKMEIYMKKNGLKFNNIDGIRFNKTQTSWFLIRASNTEEVLIVRYEGKNEEEFCKVQQIVEKILAC